MPEPTSAVGERGPHPPPGLTTPSSTSTSSLASTSSTLSPSPSASGRWYARAWLTEHRRALAMLARLAVLAVVMWLFVLPQLSGLGAWRDVLGQVSVPWIALAVATEIGSLVLYTLATQVLLPTRTRPPYDRVARIDLSAIALGHCLPDGGAAGTALSWRLLVADGVPAGDAGITKLAQGLGSAVVLMVLLLGGLLTGAALSGGLSSWAFAPTATAAGVLVVVVLVARSVASRSARARLHELVGRTPLVGARLAALFDGLSRRDVVRHLRGVVVEPARFSVAAGLSGGNWILDALTLWVCLRAFGPAVGLQSLAVIYAIQALGTWLPLTPSGLGLSESLMIPALVAFGAPHAGAVLGILAWRLLAYWLPIPLGALAYATLGRRIR